MNSLNDQNRWVIEHLLYMHRGDKKPLWTSTGYMMSLDGARGTYSLENAIIHMNDMKDHWIFRHREMRIRNIDTEEVISSAVL